MHVELIVPTSILLIAASFASVLGGMIIFVRKRWSQQSLYAIMSAGAGLLFAVTVFDLLPHAVTYKNKILLPFVVLGYSVLFVMELIGRKKGQKAGVGSIIGATSGFLIHAFLEGMSLAASFQVSTQLGLSLLFALILHKIPEGITMASLLMTVTTRRTVAFSGSLMLGVATFFGVLSVSVANRWIAPDIPHVVLAFSAGVFLFVSTSTLVPLIQQTGKVQMSLYFLAAILAYMVLPLYFGVKMHMHV